MRFLPVLAGLSLTFLAAAASAQSLKENEVLSSVSVQPISAPNPVLGADNRIDLAYELLVANTSHLFITIDKVEAVDPAGKALWSEDGNALAGMTSAFGGAGTTLAPGASAAVLLDVSLWQG